MRVSPLLLSVWLGAVGLVASEARHIPLRGWLTIALILGMATFASLRPDSHRP